MKPLTIAMIGAKGVPATFGGVERVVEEVGSRLVALGHRVIVACRADYTPPTLTQHRGIELVHAPWHVRKKGFDSLTAAASALRKILKSRTTRPDVAHFHGLGVAPLVLRAKWAGIPTVTTTHGLEWRNAQWSRPVRLFFRWCERPAMRWATVPSAVGEADAADLSTRHRRPIRLVLNGVDLPTAIERENWRHGTDCLPHEPGKPPLVPGRYVLFVGRLVPEKGPAHAITAFAHLLKNSQNIQNPSVSASSDSQNHCCLPGDVALVVVGDSPGRPDYLAYLRELAAPVADRVHFVGFRYGEQLHRLYANAAVYVQPSESEGLSLTLLEAMAHGVPIVASDIRQNCDVIGHDGGWTFPTQNPLALTAQLAPLLAPSTAMAAEIGRRCDRAVARVGGRFSWDAVTAAYLALYAEATATTARPQTAE